MATSENEDWLEQAVLNLPMPPSGPPNPSPDFLENLMLLVNITKLKKHVKNMKHVKGTRLMERLLMMMTQEIIILLIGAVMTKKKNNY
jgi:hypothetical protein